MMLQHSLLECSIYLANRDPTAQERVWICILSWIQMISPNIKYKVQYSNQQKSLMLFYCCFQTSQKTLIPSQTYQQIQKDATIHCKGLDITLVEVTFLFCFPSLTWKSFSSTSSNVMLSSIRIIGWKVSLRVLLSHKT